MVRLPIEFFSSRIRDSRILTRLCEDIIKWQMGFDGRASMHESRRPSTVLYDRQIREKGRKLLKFAK